MAQNSHGTQLEFDLAYDPLAATPTYTVVASVTGDLPHPELTRETQRYETHDSEADIHLTSPVVQRGTMSFDLLFDTGVGSHTAVRDAFLTRTHVAVRLTGPDNANNTDQVLFPGFITGFNRTGTTGAGAQMATVTFQPSGQYTVDGTDYGT